MNEHDAVADERVAAWRRSLQAHDEILNDDLRELEGHVRASAEAHAAAGASAGDALDKAIADMGVPAGIAAEYAKVDPNRVWRRRLRRMLVGPLLGGAVLHFALWVARAPHLARYSNVWGPDGPPAFHLGLLTALLALALLAAVAAPSDRMAGRRATLAAAWAWLAQHRPAAAAIGAVALVTHTFVRLTARRPGAEGLIQGLSLDPSAWPNAYLSNGFAVLPLLLMAAALYMGQRERDLAQGRWIGGYDPLWSRRVRWALSGQALVLVTPRLDHVGRIVAVLTWRAHGTVRDIWMAQGASYVLTAAAICATVAALSARREVPFTRQSSRASAWLGLGPARAALAVLAAYALGCWVQRWAYVAASGMLRVMSYAGYQEVERDWRSAWNVGSPLLALALIAWLIWQDGARARRCPRLSHGAPHARA
jgi:hypothetical protein